MTKNDDRESFLASILSEKKRLLRLFVIGAILAFSVGTLSGLFVAQTFIPQWMVLVSQVLLAVGSFVWLGKDLKLSLSFNDKLEGVVVIDTNKNEVLSVRDYKFASSLRDTLRAVRAENKAIYSEWEKEPLCRPEDDQPLTDRPDSKLSYISILRVSPEQKHPMAARLLEEAASFVLVERLSIHLSGYFNDAESDSFVKEYCREDIPSFLLKNRVLSLLSTPIEQRDIFMKVASQKQPPGELTAIWGSDGSRYSRFHLSLPQGTTIEQSEVGSIKIETKRFAFELSAKYDGCNAVVDEIFIDKYIGVDFPDVQCLKLNITLTGRIKPMSLLSGSGWVYYQWLDSFRDELKATCDFETFQESISWPAIKAGLFAVRKQHRPMVPPLKEKSKDV